MIRRLPREVMLAVASMLALASAACHDDATQPNTPPDTTGPALQIVASGYNAPLFLTAPPGDSTRVFIVEQPGAIRIVKRGVKLATPFLDVSGLISCCGERGLLGLAFHPAYASNGYFYVSYTDPLGDLTLVRYHVSANPDLADSASHSFVLSQAHQTYTNHNGGNIVFGPDGYLYIGYGDGGSGGDPLGSGQSRTTLLGKILRIDVNAAGAPYGIPASNPFYGLSSARNEIWAYGLRNPWRFSFDRSTHELYIGDVGQNDIEEVDIEAPGSGGHNYGWNTMEGTSCYPYGTTGCATAGLTLPVIDYTHASGCSVTGGYVYRGSAIPSIAGTYFYSDYCGGWVHSFRWDGAQVSDQRDWPQLRPGGAVSSFGEDGLGELYVISHEHGEVYRFVPQP